MNNAKPVDLADLTDRTDRTEPADAPSRRLVAGDVVAPFALTTLSHGVLALPGPGFVHLQFRRFAGCPVCNLHLQSFVRGLPALQAAGVTTVASILAMAAHVDGRSASVVDMTGLAQKGGAVFSHVRIGETEETVVGGRVPAASTQVLIACDLLSADGPDALALYAKDRTVAVGNADFTPTADFVTDRDVR